MARSEIRVASYNVRKARGLDQRRKPERTLEVINRLDADVVVLQEADRRLGQRKPAIPRAMIERETDYALVEVALNGSSLGFHGNAVLVKDPALVMDVLQIDLPGTEPRGAVRVDLGIGDGLSVIAVHLGLMRRDRQAQLNAVEKAATTDRHTVVAGDFNEWSSTRGLGPLETRFDVYAPGRSFHARRPLAALDRFALTSGLDLRDGGVEEGALARVASDHLPVWTDIRVPSLRATC